ncbi:hypothetical protein ABT025_11750 [Streptomyces sp. NPDC002809]|uniref:hypothetical protein n=1 Tax=Streptomyces sp. NPDC002809 TaxID=3154433 RepID=UPI0033280DA1
MEADAVLGVLIGAIPDLTLGVPGVSRVPQASFIADGLRQPPVTLWPARGVAAV